MHDQDLFIHIFFLRMEDNRKKGKEKHGGKSEGLLFMNRDSPVWRVWLMKQIEAAALFRAHRPARIHE